MDYEERKKAYFRSRNRGRIIWCVAGVHALIVFVPLALVALWDTFVPKEYVIEVGLADAPLGDSLDLPQTQTPEVQPLDIPDMPKPTTVTEPMPEVETLPEPVVEPENTPEILAPPVEPKKVEPKKTEPKKDEPKKSTILKPSEITVVKPTKVTPKSTPSTTASTLSSELKNLSGQIGKYGTTNPGSQGILTTAEMEQYLAKLKAYVEPKWKQPDAASINNAKPSATITLTIDSKGKVTAKSVTKKSGIAAMDRSIDALLATLTVVPAPPKGNTTIPITLTVR